MSSIVVWFRSLFRPDISHVTANIYENGKLKNIVNYDETRLRILGECIQMLWEVPENSSYWFEAEFVTHTRCFQKPRYSLEVVCYIQDMMAEGFKRRVAIPVNYRRKMFDRVHIIRPAKVNNLLWPKLMEVKFVLTDR